MSRPIIQWHFTTLSWFISLVSRGNEIHYLLLERVIKTLQTFVIHHRYQVAMQYLATINMLFDYQIIKEYMHNKHSIVKCKI